MKPESLETLLLDRALGQLAPEVDDLLATHLAHDAVAARLATTLTATVSLARKAAAPLTTPQPRAERSADAQWRRVRRAWRWRTMGRDGLKLAAGLALGLAVAWLVRPALPPRAATPEAAPMRTVATAELRSASRAAPAFWSEARFVAQAQRASAHATNTANPYQPRWLAPAPRPKPEDKS